MSTRTAQNNAVAVKDVWSNTIGGTWVAADVVNITIAGKTLAVTIGSLVTTAQVATTVSQAFNASSFTDTTASCIPQGGGQSIPEMKKYVATVSGSVLILTARTAGIPGVISTTKTSTSGTVSITNTVPATGPLFANNTANWVEGSLPIDADAIVIDGPIRFLYGLDMNTIQPASITFTNRCTNVTQIGLPAYNADGYTEYLDTEWKIGSVLTTIYGAAGLIKINAGTDPIDANVYGAGTTLETGFPPIQLRGTHASNSVKVFGGSVGFATRGETATLATAIQSGQGVLHIGANAALTNISGTVTVSPV